MAIVLWPNFNFRNENPAEQNGRRNFQRPIQDCSNLQTFMNQSQLVGFFYKSILSRLNKPFDENNSSQAKRKICWAAKLCG